MGGSEVGVFKNAFGIPFLGTDKDSLKAKAVSSTDIVDAVSNHPGLARIVIWMPFECIFQQSCFWFSTGAVVFLTMETNMRAQDFSAFFFGEFNDLLVCVLKVFSGRFPFC